MQCVYCTVLTLKLLVNIQSVIYNVERGGSKVEKSSLVFFSYGLNNAALVVIIQCWVPLTMSSEMSEVCLLVIRTKKMKGILQRMQGQNGMFYLPFTSKTNKILIKLKIHVLKKMWLQTSIIQILANFCNIAVYLLLNYCNILALIAFPPVQCAILLWQIMIIKFSKVDAIDDKIWVYQVKQSHVIPQYLSI